MLTLTFYVIVRQDFITGKMGEYVCVKMSKNFAA